MSRFLDGMNRHLDTPIPERVAQVRDLADAVARRAQHTRQFVAATVTVAAGLAGVSLVAAVSVAVMILWGD